MKDMQRLDKVLGHMGCGTRRELKEYIKKGDVTVNGQVVRDSSLQIRPQHDEIMFRGKLVEYKQYIYLMMNKPSGVISATEDVKDRTVVDLLSPDHAAFEPFPVGRLDKDTEGLLILTNDGQLAHQLLSPKKHVPKVYYAVVDGRMTSQDVDVFAEGIELDDGVVTLPAILSILEVRKQSDSEEMTMIELTITEGKFHQVKRMVAAVGKKVIYLKRLSMGNLQLDPLLPKGSVRELTQDELTLLRMTNPSSGQSIDD